MNVEQMEELRRALADKRAELTATQHRAEEIAIERVADATDELVLATQRDLAIDTLSRDAIVLGLVTEALARIASGAYGICLECGEPIPAKRLAALPWAALCLKCQEAADQVTDRKKHGGPDSWLPDAA